MILMTKSNISFPRFELDQGRKKVMPCLINSELSEVKKETPCDVQY